MNRKWVYVLLGAALVAGGLVLATRLISAGVGEDPITEAQDMLDRAQSKVSEIEAGLRNRGPAPQPA